MANLLDRLGSAALVIFGLGMFVVPPEWPGPEVVVPLIVVAALRPVVDREERHVARRPRAARAAAMSSRPIDLGSREYTLRGLLEEEGGSETRRQDIQRLHLYATLYLRRLQLEDRYATRLRMFEAWAAQGVIEYRPDGAISFPVPARSRD